MKLTRRSLLKAGAGGAAVGTSGCLDSPLQDGVGADRGYAAFFAPWDWAEHVSGGGLDFQNPVESGRLGHGWSPDGDLTRDVASSDIFVYLDTPEFSWAQDVADNLRRDYGGVTVLDLLDGIEDHLRGVDRGGDTHTHANGDTHAHDDGDTATHADGNADDDTAAGEDGEFFDPHVWTDPVLVETMIESITDALVGVDPDNESGYRDNAADYVEEVRTVHRRFEELTDGVDRAVAVLAGHDSFSYLERRYGFELHTPVGTAPDAAESFDDVSRLVETIEANDIETVLYDPFEATDGGLPRMVELIFEHSDAEEAEPLSSVAGTTETWNERGWGWTEQMTELNLPSLRKALEAGG